MTRGTLYQLNRISGLFCRNWCNTVTLHCTSWILKYFNEEIVPGYSTEAQFYLDKRPKIWTMSTCESISNVCIVCLCVYLCACVCVYPWMVQYSTTLQREHRKGGVSIQNYVMTASCLAFPRALGDWKASRTPGCDFIKVWNERSVTRRSHTWHPAAGPFFPASSPQPRALMAPLWKSVSLIPLRDPSTALSAADTNLIPDRSVRWKPCLSRLLINVALLSLYRTVYLKFMTRVRTDGIVQR